MISIRTYDGDADEVARFTETVWRQTYGKQLAIPIWDPQFFDWQLAERPRGRDLLVAAYQGASLVGTLFGEDFRFRLHDQEFDAALSSWLTVDSQHRGQGIGTKLVQESRKRLEAKGGKCLLGVGIHGTHSAGPKFWATFPETVVLRRGGWWAKVLDPRSVARWDLRLAHRVGIRMTSLLPKLPQLDNTTTDVRPYRAGDLGACVKLLNGLSHSVDLSCIWEPLRLAHQLQYKNFPKTLVLDHAGEIVGLVNYYHLSLLARTTIRVGMIDFIVSSTNDPSSIRALLLSMLCRMHQDEIQLAIYPRLAGMFAMSLLKTGFVPLPSDYQMICYLTDLALPIRSARRLLIPIR